MEHDQHLPIYFTIDPLPPVRSTNLEVVSRIRLCSGSMVSMRVCGHECGRGRVLVCLAGTFVSVTRFLICDKSPNMQSSYLNSPGGVRWKQLCMRASEDTQGVALLMQFLRQWAAQFQLV